MHDLLDPRVAIVHAPGPYPARPPFSPPERYPEFPFASDEEFDPSNRVYPALRRMLLALGLDSARFGTPAWNPLGELIRPGQRVVLKPNYILHQHLSGRDHFAVVTHSALVRAVIDYVHIALRGDGEITVADAPQANADWDRLVTSTGIAKTLAALAERHGLAIGLIDLRQLQVIQRHGITVERRRTTARARIVDLGPASEFSELGGTLGNLCGSDYDRRLTVGGHRHGHRYAAALPILEADVLISLPKLKVHKKTGVSLNLKNMVGINADKNYIPHYRVGDARSGGDEFPVEPNRIGRLRDRLARFAIDNLLGRLDRVAAPILSAVAGAYHRRTSPTHALDATDAGHNQAVIRLVYRRLLGKPIRAGNWDGNDTLWRAILDLNRIALYADDRGRLLDVPARRYFSIIDGVVGGAGEGPMDPDPVAANVLIGGFNPVLVDLAATRLMGLDPAAIALFQHAARAGRAHPLAAPGLVADVYREPAVDVPAFRPPAGWPELAARGEESLAS